MQFQINCTPENQSDSRNTALLMIIFKMTKMSMKWHFKITCFQLLQIAINTNIRVILLNTLNTILLNFNILLPKEIKIMLITDVWKNLILKIRRKSQNVNFKIKLTDLSTKIYFRFQSLNKTNRKSSQSCVLSSSKLPWKEIENITFICPVMHQ